MTHSPGPPLATPLLLGSPAPCSPLGAPKPAAAGGVEERHGLPLLRAGTRGARRGDRRGQGALPPARGRRSTACVARGESVHGGGAPAVTHLRGGAPRPGPPPARPAARHSLRGHVASCRPRGHAVGWRPGGARGSQDTSGGGWGTAAEGTAPGSRADGRAQPAAASAAPPPTPTSATAARAQRHLHRPGCERRVLLHLPAQAMAPQPPAEKGGAEG